ncbi:long-chain-acyl-CoA synthetase [Limnobacter sp.]|uniref:long-chain-acyl-CoA synthetase n=1 Tax=Limnobacter sp. TaxID=2003368 RepID=UPI00351984D5
MTYRGKNVSALELGAGALAMLPDVPRILPKLLKMAVLRPESRRSLGLEFQNAARQYADRPFLRFENAQWTYAQANAQVNQMARGLASLGLKADDVVGLLADNRPSLLLAVLACTKLGCVAALLNPHQQGRVLAHSIGLVQPKVILCSQEGLALLSSLKVEHPRSLDGVECLVLDAASGSLPNSDFKSAWVDQAPHDLPQTDHVLAKQPCFYIFTSGTTGLPKASVMTHYRWLQAMSGLGSAVRLGSSDVLYCCLPLYHNNALTVSLGVTLAGGACFALDGKFSASRFWQRIRHHKATAFCYIGELLRYLLNQPKGVDDQNHEVRLILGNGLRPEIWREFEERFGIEHIYEFYGASESNLGFMNTFGLRETVGFSPIPFEVVACDPDTEQPIRTPRGRCKKVARGEVGLLISEVTPLRPFDGYTDPKANEAKLLRDVFKKGDCWFNSGDLVRRQGWQHIQFVDRLGDTFRWKGENVSTSEVEGVLARVPWLADAVVYGVQVPGQDGRAGMAALTLKPGCQFDGPALAHHLSRELPSYAVPLYVRILPKLETTGTFKHQKATLKKQGITSPDLTSPVYALNPDKSDYLPLAARV